MKWWQILILGFSLFILWAMVVGRTVNTTGEPEPRTNTIGEHLWGSRMEWLAQVQSGNGMVIYLDVLRDRQTGVCFTVSKGIFSYLPSDACIRYVETAP